MLFKAAQWIRDHKYDLIAIKVVEAGKPWADADGDSLRSRGTCEYYGHDPTGCRR